MLCNRQKVNKMDKGKKLKKGWAAQIKSLISYVLLFLVIGWGVDLWRAQSLVSGKAPELIATTVQGEKIDLLAMSEEKPVLVYFWATWCGVCSTVSPSVDFIHDNYQVVTVALNSGSNKRIKQYLAAKDYDFSVVSDPKGLVSRDWGISVTPTFFVVNKGEVSSITTGFTSPFGLWGRLLLARF